MLQNKIIPVIKEYFRIIVVTVSLTVSFSLLHHIFILKINPDSISLVHFISPVFIGIILAILITWINKSEDLNRHIRDTLSKGNRIRLQGKNPVFYYGKYVLLILLITIPAATIQNLFVMKVLPQNLTVKTYIIPTLVSVIFGILIGKIEILNTETRLQYSLLEEKEAELQKMNQSLEEKVEERTRELQEVENVTREILDSQGNIVILTNGIEVQDANQSFFNFFFKYKTIAEFRTKHECICEFFLTREDENYISKTIKGENWVHYIASHPEKIFTALMKDQYGNHTIFDVKINKTQIKNQSLFVATFTDISTLVNYKNELFKHKEKLQTQLYTDNLTQASNRLRLLKDLSHGNAQGSLLLINIDAFKEINDFFGHQTGDIIIIEVIDRIIHTIREETGHVYRISGDEFAVKIHQSMPKEDLLDFIDQVYHAIVDAHFTGNMDTEISINVSMGAATCDDIKNSSDSLITLADLALKNAKSSQKHYMLYSSEIGTRKEFGKNIHQAILVKNAITSNNILPYYQPILDNANGVISKYECLARIRANSGEIIYPDSFIQAAKTTRLYPNITISMLEQSARKFAGTDFDFSINISIDDIANSETRNRMFAIIGEHKIADRLILELIESEGIENFREVNSFIENAKSMGVRIAIDDFGSGYSNFEYIMKLDVDFLKIDGSIIRHIATDENSRIVARTINDFARAMNIQTIAEYVSSEEIFNQTKQMGIHYSQGYHIGKPEADFPDSKKVIA